MIDTAPLLDAAFAAKLRVTLLLRMKSPSTAGVTAAADTVTSKAVADTGSTVAVILLTPAFSETDAGSRTSVTCGIRSSTSVTVTVIAWVADIILWAVPLVASTTIS